MNRKLLIVISGALIMAVLVALMMQSSLKPKDTKNKVVEAKTEVLVANKTLLKGEVLKAKDVSWKSFYKASIFKGMVKKAEQADVTKLKVHDKILRRNIEVGEPITTQALIMDIKGGSKNLSVKLDPGMRAVGIVVKAETTAGGFIAPDDRVDVILTYQVKLKGEISKYSSEAVQKFATETIITNARVLAVDQNDKSKAYTAKLAKTITLEVDAEGAQKLNMAASMGKLSLALRRMGEKDTVADQNIPVSTDVLDSKVISHIYNEMNLDKSMSNTVRVYNGADIVDVPVSTSPLATGSGR